MLSSYANYDSDTVDPITSLERGGIKTNSSYISQPQQLTSETGLAIFLTANNSSTLKFDIVVEFTNIIQEPYDFINTYSYNQASPITTEIFLPKQAQYFRIKIITYEFPLTNLKVNTFLVTNLYNTIVTNNNLNTNVKIMTSINIDSILKQTFSNNCYFVGTGYGKDSLVTIEYEQGDMNYIPIFIYGIYKYNDIEYVTIISNFYPSNISGAINPYKYAGAYFLNLSKFIGIKLLNSGSSSTISNVKIKIFPS
jgi:hypothetical protein